MFPLAFSMVAYIGINPLLVELTKLSQVEGDLP